ncbi:hypothetical protein CEXT_658051 [Caerostris extrusa]|uniref:Uncharacterized protein n=1 Tax=Caerostris extrusa TaxID=172846 RepID=A0AAV4XGS1_CAEEX|nr:hypothetical protein CEXT_658051 [Caerostris extrusa]
MVLEGRGLTLFPQQTAKRMESRHFSPEDHQAAECPPPVLRRERKERISDAAHRKGAGPSEGDPPDSLRKAQAQVPHGLPEAGSVPGGDLERACNSCSTRGRQKNSVLFQD